jgi:hypothetical protein
VLAALPWPRSRQYETSNQGLAFRGSLALSDKRTCIAVGDDRSQLLRSITPNSIDAIACEAAPPAGLVPVGLLSASL